MQRSDGSRKRSPDRSPSRASPPAKSARSSGKHDGVAKHSTGRLVATAARSGTAAKRPQGLKLPAGAPRPTKLKAKKPADGKLVHTVEIRPAGTVVSRRPLKKRVAVRHLPQHPEVSLKPPSWMLEECRVAPARAAAATCASPRCGCAAC